MALRSPGRLITATAPTITSGGTGMGIFTGTEVAQYKQAGTWPNALNIIADYLVVAGGGGGGISYGAGGGAGGLLTGSSVILNRETTYTITVGAGGSTDVSGSNSSVSGTLFSTVTAIGGGYGGKYASPANGANGGSGGGGASGNIIGVGGKGVYPGSSYFNQARQGYDGGSSLQGGGYASGGGGGAGGVGADVSGSGSSGKGGNGGIGVSSSITGTSTYYAGGGGGWGYSAGGGGGTGGSGGGGNGESYPSGNQATAGTVNTGGGGGGDGTAGVGKAGGSGVVILRFLSTVTVSATTGSPTITTDGSYSVYKYTASGSITF